MPLSCRANTPHKDTACSKPLPQNRTQVKSLSAVFGGAPIKRSETPADKKKQQPTASPTEVSLEDVISLEDLESNSQDAWGSKVHTQLGTLVYVFV